MDGQTSGFHQAMDMPATARLMIKKLQPDVNPAEVYRWVLARYDADNFQMIIIDQFLTFADALSEVDNIQHLIEEGHL